MASRTEGQGEYNISGYTWVSLQLSVNVILTPQTIFNGLRCAESASPLLLRRTSLQVVCPFPLDDLRRCK